MAQNEVLNNVDHKDLRVLTDRTADLGYAVMGTHVFPTEFRNVQGNFPILFQKATETGKFYAMAIFGFEQGENLFLSEDGFDTAYVPIMLEKGPFAIGKQQAENGEETGIISVNMDHPTISKTAEGQQVFLDFGGNSDYLEHITDILGQAHDGMEVNDHFMNALVDNDLLEQLNLEISLQDGSVNRLAGFYIINEEKLKQLSADVLFELNGKGFLEAIYMVTASLSQMQELVNRKNAKVG